MHTLTRFLAVVPEPRTTAKIDGFFAYVQNFRKKLAVDCLQLATIVKHRCRRGTRSIHQVTRETLVEAGRLNVVHVGVKNLAGEVRVRRLNRWLLCVHSRVPPISLWFLRIEKSIKIDMFQLSM